MDIICPLSLTSRYNDIYKKVDFYVRNQLSLNHILKELDDFECMKKFVYTSQELYVLENYDKLKNRMLNYRKQDCFELEKFKSSYQQLTPNLKFMNCLQ
jgi:hypothetical protein